MMGKSESSFKNVEVKFIYPYRFPSSMAKKREDLNLDMVEAILHDSTVQENLRTCAGQKEWHGFLAYLVPHDRVLVGQPVKVPYKQGLHGGEWAEITTMLLRATVPGPTSPKDPVAALDNMVFDMKSTEGMQRYWRGFINMFCQRLETYEVRTLRYLRKLEAGFRAVQQEPDKSYLLLVLQGKAFPFDSPQGTSSALLASRLGAATLQEYFYLYFTEEPTGQEAVLTARVVDPSSQFINLQVMQRTTAPIEDTPRAYYSACLDHIMSGYVDTIRTRERKQHRVDKPQYFSRTPGLLEVKTGNILLEGA
jgi:hypothetical protein